MATMYETTPFHNKKRTYWYLIFHLFICACMQVTFDNLTSTSLSELSFQLSHYAAMAVLTTNYLT
jgi:hypothetical protein